MPATLAPLRAHAPGRLAGPRVSACIFGLFMRAGRFSAFPRNIGALICHRSADLTPCHTKPHVNQLGETKNAIAAGTRQKCVCTYKGKVRFCTRLATYRSAACRAEARTPQRVTPRHKNHTKGDPLSGMAGRAHQLRKPPGKLSRNIFFM